MYKRVRRTLQQRDGFIRKKYTRSAVIYLCEVVEYLITEIMENAGLNAKENADFDEKKVVVKVENLQESFEKDDEFKEFFGESAMEMLNKEADDGIRWKRSVENDSDDSNTDPDTTDESEDEDDYRLCTRCKRCKDDDTDDTDDTEDESDSSNLKDTDDSDCD